MDFGEVLSRAWQIIWKYKVLWIFGILASCSGGGRGSSSSGAEYRVTRGLGNIPSPYRQYFVQPGGIPTLETISIVLIILLIILILAVLFIFFGTMGRIGLIRGTLQAERGAERLTFGELFSGSLPFFWRVFGFNLLIWVAVAVTVLIAAVPFIILTCGLGAIVLMVLIWLVEVIQEQAIIAIVIENLGILEGLQRGWGVVRTNLGPMILMGLILLFGVGWIGTFIILLPILAILAPSIVAIVSSAMSGARVVLSGALLIAGLCLVAYLPVAIFLGGILRSYIGTAWTLTYMRLTSRPAAAPVQASPAD